MRGETGDMRHEKKEKNSLPAKGGNREKRNKIKTDNLLV